MKPELDYNDWLEALKLAYARNTEPDGGLRRSDIDKIWGTYKDKTLTILAELKAAGVVETFKAYRTNVQGVDHRVGLYRLVPQNGEDDDAT